MLVRSDSFRKNKQNLDEDMKMRYSWLRNIDNIMLLAPYPQILTKEREVQQKLTNYLHSSALGDFLGDKKQINIQHAKN